MGAALFSVNKATCTWPWTEVHRRKLEKKRNVSSFSVHVPR